LNVEAYVWVVGTLTGDWVAYKNNTYTFLCLPEECWVANIEQVGPRKVSRIDGPTRYPVIRWTPDEVIASDNTLCSKITITIGRKTQELLWVEMSINQATIQCKNANNAIRKATIETSLYWQRSKSNKLDKKAGTSRHRSLRRRIK